MRVIFYKYFLSKQKNFLSLLFFSIKSQTIHHKGKLKSLLFLYFSIPSPHCPTSSFQPNGPKEYFKSLPLCHQIFVLILCFILLLLNCGDILVIILSLCLVNHC